ncbi:unnamed protein product [Absidia cylindrospora]
MPRRKSLKELMKIQTNSLLYITQAQRLILQLHIAMKTAFTILFTQSDTQNHITRSQNHIQQYLNKNIKLNQLKGTALSSEEVINTIGWSEESEESDKAPLRSPSASPQQPYFFVTEQPPSPESEWSRSHNLQPEPTSESQPYMKENIDHTQSMQHYMGTSTMDESHHSLEHRLTKSHQQTRLTTDITRLYPKSTLARNRSPSPPRLKRVRFWEPHSPSQLDVEYEQQQPTTSFLAKTTSSQHETPSPPQTTTLQSYTQSSSTIPLSLSSNTRQEFHQLQLINEHNTISNTQLDHSGDTQQTGKTVVPITLSQSWSRRRQNLWKDTSVSVYQQQDLTQPPPIYNLNDDCLIEILKWCATTQTLCAVSSVCKHWRNVALLPYVWRTINYTWDKLVQLLVPTPVVDNRPFSLSRTGRSARPNSNNDLLLSSPLVHIRTINLINSNKSTIRCTPSPKTPIFTSLRTLQLSAMHYTDILDLIAWTKHLKELDCNGILSHASNDVVMITPFSDLRKLQVLKLHFATTCELIGPTSLTSDNGTGNTKHSTTDRWRFPRNLHTLNITNVYDIEEFLTSGNSASWSAHHQQQQAIVPAERMDELVRTWNEMENTLVTKYRVLSTLGKLTNLSLGHCTGYTARIWRECIAPCSKNLKRLSLCGWIGNGNRESPLAWKERHDMASMTHTSVDLYMEDVEKALADVFAGLYHLQSLTLIDFKCTKGVVQGMDRLVEATGKSFLCNNLQTTMNNDNINNSNSVMDSSLPTLNESSVVSSSPAYFRNSIGCHFANTEIKLYYGSSVVRKKNNS